MAGEAIVEDLELDISAALTSIDTLSSALDTVASGFGSEIADAINAAFGNIALPEFDAGAITSGLDSALGGVGTITPQVDESAIEAQVNDALDQPRAPIEVDADTAPVQAAIDAIGSTALDIPVNGDVIDLQNAIAGVDGTSVDVPVTGDITTLEDAIASVQAQPVDLTVDADTSEAQDAFTSLGDSATQAAGGGSGGGVASLSNAVLATKVATDSATGGTKEFQGALAGVSSEAALAVGAGAAFTGFLGEAANKAADAQAQQARFNQVFGASASIVQSINVGGLVTSFDDLARATGTPIADLEAASSKLGQVGESAGVATPKVAETTSNLIALAATISVTNPRLGDTADVMNALERALVRPGVRLQQLGLGFTTAQLQAEAFNETGKSVAADLTTFDKIQAGVTLGLQQFGDTLGTKFASGAQNAQVQFRAFKTELEEALVALGTPLLSPVETVFKDLIPVAVDLGQVLGNLGQIVLPVLAALAPALIPVGGALHLVADGLGVIASAVDAVPVPVLGALAGGLIAVGAATGALDGAIAALTAFADTNPALLAVTATLAVIGALVDTFGSHTSEAAKDSKAWSDALFANSDTAQGLSADIANLNQNLATTETKFIESFKVGSDFRSALDGIGGGTAGLNAALLGTNAQFETYRLSVEASAVANGEFAGSADRQGQSLEAQRKGLQDSIQGQLASYISTGSLTQAQLLQIESQNRLSDGTVNYAKVLDLANQGVAAFNEQQAAATVANHLTDGSLRSTLAGYTLASGGAESLTSALAALGIEQSDAKAIAKDVADETQKQADAQISAAPAAAQLAAQFATGQISAGQYAAALLQMGVSVDGLNTAMGDGAKAQQDYQTALTASSDATLLASSSATHLRTELADGTITAAQAQAGFEALGVSVGGSEAALKGITDIATELADSVKKLPTAADALTSYSQTVATDTQKIASDMKDVAAKHKGATQSLLTDTKQLADDSSPQRFIDNLNKQTLEIAAFQKNIDTLFSHGFTDVGALLASQGPAVAGGLAQALAGSPAQAATANAAVATSNKFTASYVGDIQGKIGEFTGAGVTAGQSVATGVSQGLGGLVGKINVALASAGHAITSDPALAAAARAAGDHVTTEFNGRFRIHDGVVDRSHQTASFLISGDNPIPGAAGGSATTATGAYDSALGLPGSTQNQMAAAGAVFGGQARINLANSARSAGGLVGQQFDKGIADGINGSTGVIASAAASAAATAETAAKARLKSNSPSLVGVQIGQDFTTGIAIGLGATDSITTGALALTTALISSVPDPTARGVSIARAFTDGIASGLADHSAVTRNSVELTDTILKSIQGLSGAAFKAAHESTAALATIDPRAGAAANDVLNIESSKYAIAQEKLDAVRAQREAQVAFLQGEADTVKADLARSANDLTKIHQNQARITADTAQLKLIQAQNAAALTPPKSVTAATVAGVPFSPFTASPALSPFVAAAAGPAAGQGLVQFALTINLADGTTRQVTTEPIAVQPSRPGQLQQLVIAEVKAL